MQTIICSHGFGVKADGRGLFTELATALSDCTFITFDYNTILENDDIQVATLDEQATKLQKVIDQNAEASILLCHSQGCVVAGLIDLSRVSKVILLAPPTKMSIQAFMGRMMKRPGSEINLHGISKLARSDGTTTLVPASYVQSLVNVDPFALYERIAKSKPTLIVRATEDEVVGLTDVDKVRLAVHKDIKCDHNFSDTARSQLIAALNPFIG